jgi:enamine deaminase RidA (YjgF/YER057c/UK114 family)
MTITMNTRTIPLITFTVAICLFTGIASQRSYSQERKAVNLSPTRGLPFSDGIVAGNTLYVAGQEGTDESNKLAAGGIGPGTTAHLRTFRRSQGRRLRTEGHRQCHRLSGRHS